MTDTTTGYTVTYTKHGRKLTSTLYGTITPDRIERAKAELAHRADQLYSVSKPEPIQPHRGWRGNVEPEWDDVDEFDDRDDE